MKTLVTDSAGFIGFHVAKRLLERGDNVIGFDMASNPQFLKEGSAVADCQKPDRIIIGTEDEGSAEVMRELYAPFSRQHEKIIVMDVKNAELTKYAANCMLAAGFTGLVFSSSVTCMAIATPCR